MAGIRNLASDRAAKACPYFLRRVEVYDPVTEQILVCLTNDAGLGATTVAAIYKDRWQVELFFKALKQNLKIKTFVGTSANALHIQVWTALIAMLLLRYLQLRARFAWSLSNLVALLRMNLFTYRDLWARLHAPYTTHRWPLARSKRSWRLGKPEFGQHRPGGVIRHPADRCPNPQESRGSAPHVAGIWTAVRRPSTKLLRRLGLGVDPMEILDHHQQRLDQGLAQEQPLDRVEYLLSAPGWIETLPLGIIDRYVEES